MAVPPSPGRGQPALPALSGTGRRCAGIQHRPCRDAAGHLCRSGKSSLRSRENFGLKWVPSLLLSCSHRSQRRLRWPRARGCPLSPCTPAGWPPHPNQGPAGPLPFLPLIFQPALLLGARLHFQGQLH